MQVSLKVNYGKSHGAEKVMLAMACMYVSAPVGVISWNSKALSNAINRMNRFVKQTDQARDWIYFLNKSFHMREMSEISRVIGEVSLNKMFARVFGKD